MNQTNQALLAAGISITVVGLALARRNLRGGAGDDRSTAAGRTYGALPLEPDDGGPEHDQPVWRDHLTHDPRWDEEAPPGLMPRARRSHNTQEPE